MRSEKQKQASRINGAKGKGPTTPEGKNRSKFNGLKHGLRTEQVVLPGEDPAEFQAELDGWAGDWRPRTHTRAALVERTAAACWRLRRCVRAEADLLREQAGARPAGRDVAADDDVIDEVDNAHDWFTQTPAESTRTLMASTLGVDRMIGYCDDLDAALDDGPDAWDDRNHHHVLMALFGHPFGADPAACGPVVMASSRLLATNDDRDGPHPDGPMTDAEADDAVERLRGAIALRRDRLRAHRATLVGEPDGREDGPVKFCAVSHDHMLLHRYEMALDRSFRATLKELVGLEKSGADLAADEAEAGAKAEPKVKAEPKAKAEPRAAEAVPQVVASQGQTAPHAHAPTEPESPTHEASRTGPDRDRGARTRPHEVAEGGRSPA